MKVWIVWVCGMTIEDAKIFTTLKQATTCTKILAKEAETSLNKMKKSISIIDDDCFTTWENDHDIIYMRETTTDIL